MEALNISKTKADSLGVSGKEGFIGRWQISAYESRDFGRDMWCEGTSYRIMPFHNTKNDFTDKCMSAIATTCDESFVNSMKSVKVQRFYVPMMKAGNRYVCLHSQMAELSFFFFDNGISLLPDMPAEVFDTAKIEKSHTEFLSIWLSVADVKYHAASAGISVDMNADPEVTFAPVNRLSFECEGKEYVMMSWGDAAMSHFIHTPLPEDPKLNSRRLVYSVPFITMTSMLVLISAVCGLCLHYAWKIWNLLDWFVPFKLIVLAIPIFLVYLIAWRSMIIIARICKKLFLSIEKMICRKKQRDYISGSLDRKQYELMRRFPGVRLALPSVADYSIDTASFDKHYDQFLNRLVEVGKKFS